MSDELIEIFLQETNENLQIFEEGLLELEKATENQYLIDDIFRAMHTIKGGAGLVGFTTISNLAHYMENILERIRNSEIDMSPEIITLLLNGSDLIKKLLADNETEKEITEEIDGLIQSLTLVSDKAIREKPASDEIKRVSSKTTFYRITLQFNSDIFETGTDPLMLFLELTEKGKIITSFINTASLPDIYSLDPYRLYIKWTLFYETTEDISEIENVFIFVKDDNHIIIEDISENLSLWFAGNEQTKSLFEKEKIVEDGFIDQALEKQKNAGVLLNNQNTHIPININKEKKTLEKIEVKQTKTIRVDSQKLEVILNYIAELLITQSHVKELVLKNADLKKSTNVEIFNAFQEVDKIIRLLQEEVLNASMVPIGSTFVRFQRMARDLAKEKGKDINVVISGKETELDKRVIEQIADPLKHLIRNSIDHGLEYPEERKAQGKPPQGTIFLNAYHQEGNIVIEISDDGRGIDEEAVLKKAIEKALIPENSNLSSSEIQQLLFMPGFSTAKQITDISGRGVGLDVVMTNIKSLRGSLELISKKGEGTKFIVRLPLTLAIIDGMIVRVGEERFIIPLTSISEFLKLDSNYIVHIDSKNMLVNIRKEYIPYIGLYKLLNAKPQYTKPTDGILVIIKESTKHLALLVDEIIGQEQVVIKSLKENMGHVDGVAGATILGDGKVAIILDVPSLFPLARKYFKGRINESGAI